jgi:AcrR family transcriptional regulator
MHPAYASSEKRSALVQAAKGLLHEQGFAKTSLAEVAARAEVPLGNLYYYYRTKEALAEAVIASHEHDLRSLFDTWSNTVPEPGARLRRLVRMPLENAIALQFGCPHGSLCQELEKLGEDTPLATAARRLFVVYIDFATTQFRFGGLPAGAARDAAEELIASIQGAMLLGHTLRSHRLLARQLARTERRVEALLRRKARGRRRIPGVANRRREP